ncbi:hypothetical protein L226DRAFT_313026 [Lentinus tigrinus ALCF2SS1-7]|uniref:uncharacterized protein n=1 Tax=Lentinus tigrinus ALCF2SS1-7 TaxID=1328758 RepID=UPI00116603C7|nr:hypothetical protein L226DRAFT_313026 [Lentinus tigrinus ALCF2SS1-7]
MIDDRWRGLPASSNSPLSLCLLISLLSAPGRGSLSRTLTPPAKRELLTVRSATRWQLLHIERASGRWNPHQVRGALRPRPSPTNSSLHRSECAAAKFQLPRFALASGSSTMHIFKFVMTVATGRHKCADALPAARLRRSQVPAEQRDCAHSIVHLDPRDGLARASSLRCQRESGTRRRAPGEEL